MVNSRTFTSHSATRYARYRTRLIHSPASVLNQQSPLSSRCGLRERRNRSGTGRFSTNQSSVEQISDRMYAGFASSRVMSYAAANTPRGRPVMLSVWFVTKRMYIRLPSVVGITSGFTGHERTSNHFTPARLSAPCATLCYAAIALSTKGIISGLLRLAQSVFAFAMIVHVKCDSNIANLTKTSKPRRQPQLIRVRTLSES